MAITILENPMAIVTLQWISAEEGGRQTGRPDRPVYITTSVFRLGGEEQIQPNWPSTLSILIQRIKELNNYQDLAKIGFLVPELARPLLHSGAELVILEGPRPVAYAVVKKVL